MTSEKSPAEVNIVLDKVQPTLWLLTGLIILLALCWWSMPFKLFPGLQLDVPDYMKNDNGSVDGFQDSSIGDRLGFWIASKGWDAGPPPEYPYDFILFWHLALSALVYALILSRHKARIRKHAQWQRPREIPGGGLIHILFIYPLICTAIVWIYPWEAADVSAHKMISLMIYPALFWSLTMITLKTRGKWLAVSLIWMSCIIIAVLGFTCPIMGGGIDLLIILGITILITLWALVLMKMRAIKSG